MDEGVGISSLELSYLDNVRSNIQQQLDAANSGTNNASSEAKLYTDTKIAQLTNGAPTTLDTLNEIAIALNSNPSAVSVLT